MMGSRDAAGPRSARVTSRMARTLGFATAVLLVLGTIAAPSSRASVPVAAGRSATNLAWSDVTPAPTSPGNVRGDIAYDAATHQLLLVVPSQTATAFYDTWIWRGATWSPQRLTTNPNGTGSDALVYDGATRQLLLFIGFSGGSTGGSGNAWSWDGRSWQEVASSAPAFWAGGSVAYDPATAQLLAFATDGGTFSWNGVTWKSVATTKSPSPRLGASFAYDPATATMILFGGTSSQTDNGAFADTWSFNGNTWSKLKTASSPNPRRLAAMAYDPATSQLVLYGGVGSDERTRYDTWVFSNSRWTRTSGGAASAMEGASMAYDQVTSQLVLFGGSGPAYPADEDDTWIRKGSAWTGGALRPSSPEPGGSSSMAYDQATGQMVYVSNHRTWLWGAGAWTRLGPSHAAPVAYGTVAYDPASRQLLLFDPGSAGIGGYPVTLWDWNGKTWLELHPRTSPPPPASFSMAYDPSIKALVLVGVFSGTTTGTWTWNGSDWKALAPAASPPGRWDFALADDAATGQLVLYGGLTFVSNTPLSDTWVFKHGNWTELTPSSLTPPDPGAASMAYDPATAQLILFGGQPCCQSTAPATWAWNGTSWSLLSLPTSPVDRSNSAMAYDPASREIVLFGGTVRFGGTVFGDGYADTWVLSGKPSPAPKITSVVAGDGEATVSWTPPAIGGGAAINSYRVDGSSGPPVFTNAYIYSATVSGLTNGTSYTFTVTPVGEDGTYMPSTPSAAVVPRV